MIDSLVDNRNPISTTIPAIVEALGRLLRGLPRCTEDLQQTIEVGHSLPKGFGAMRPMSAIAPRPTE
jgi:hypothetical protein